MSITIPAQMHYIAMEAPGGPEVMVLATGPVPRPATGEVLIRVAAAGINRPDILQRTGATIRRRPARRPSSASRSPEPSSRSARR